MPLRESLRGPTSSAVTTALAGVPLELWDQLHRARRPLLMLDYDGTLAPYRAARPRAVPPEQTREKLAALARSARTRIAVVSGRPIRELESLLAPLVFYWVGEHGWEERAPGQPVVEHPLPAEAQAALEQALDDVRGRFGGRVERKRTGLLLQTGGLFPDSDRALCQACEAVWRPWTERAPLRLDRTNGGLELVARDRDKGTAVRGLRERAKEADLVVYVGDDDTDEDAFRALGESGYGIRVGESGTTTLARGTLPSAAAVSDFLGHWVEADAHRSGAT